MQLKTADCHQDDIFNSARRTAECCGHVGWSDDEDEVRPLVKGCESRHCSHERRNISISIGHRLTDISENGQLMCHSTPLLLIDCNAI